MFFGKNFWVTIRVRFEMNFFFVDLWNYVEFVGVVLRAADTFQVSTAALSEGIPQLDKTLGRTGQTFEGFTYLIYVFKGQTFCSK